MIRCVDFDKIRLLPRLTDVNSRSECDTKIELTGLELSLPVLIPPMNALVSTELINNVKKFGTVTVLPRGSNFGLISTVGKQLVLNCKIEDALTTLDNLYNYDRYEYFAVDMKIVLSIEVANGYMKKLGETIEKIKNKYPDSTVWAGTVCTPEGVEFLEKAGADAVLVGIGVGSACTTTPTTGIGLPAFFTTQICADVAKKPIILTGGLREHGDVAKALVAGASAVYAGALIKGCMDTKSPSLYWGEASALGKQLSKNVDKNTNVHYIEGKDEKVHLKNKTSAQVLQEIKEALQSSMSYSNARTIEEFRKNASYVYLD